MTEVLINVINLLITVHIPQLRKEEEDDGENRSCRGIVGAFCAQVASTAALKDVSLVRILVMRSCCSSCGILCGKGVRIGDKDEYCPILIC